MTHTLTFTLYKLSRDRGFKRKSVPVGDQTLRSWPIPVSYSSAKIKNRGQHYINRHSKPVRKSGRCLPKVVYHPLLKRIRDFHCSEFILNSLSSEIFCGPLLPVPPASPHTTKFHRPGLSAIPRTCPPLSISGSSHLQHTAVMPLPNLHLAESCSDLAFTSSVPPSRRPPKIPKEGEKYSLLCL